LGEGIEYGGRGEADLDEARADAGGAEGVQVRVEEVVDRAQVVGGRTRLARRCSLEQAEVEGRRSVREVVASVGKEAVIARVEVENELRELSQVEAILVRSLDDRRDRVGEDAVRRIEAVVFRREAVDHQRELVSAGAR